MSFFGIDNNDLENEKRKYLEGRLDDGSDIPVYTWGTERYDGLGEALQEGDDDLNDETFGGTGPVGVSDPLCTPTSTTNAVSLQARTLISPSQHFSPMMRLQSHLHRSHAKTLSIGIRCWIRALTLRVSVAPEICWYFLQTFPFHSATISGLVRVAMGRPLHLLDVTACERDRPVWNAWSTPTSPTSSATASPIFLRQIFSLWGGRDPTLRVTSYLTCFTATTAPGVIQQSPTGCGANP